MVSEIATELLVVLLLLLVNAVFAMSEMAVVTSRKVRLERRAEKGGEGAAAALARYLDERPDRSSVGAPVGPRSLRDHPLARWSRT